MKREAKIMLDVKAVLFDLDGTLIDTERYYRRMWPKALEHFGYHMSDEQYLSLRSLGRSFARDQFKEWYGEDFDYDAVRAYRSALFSECVKADGGIKAKTGAVEILSWLGSRGIICAIATATDRDRAENFLTQAGLISYFDRICCASQVKEGKPKPDLYLFACRELGLSPDECLAVEDAPNGIRSAAAAGLRVVFVPDQTQDEPEVEELIYARAEDLTGLKNIILESS